MLLRASGGSGRQTSKGASKTYDDIERAEIRIKRPAES